MKKILIILSLCILGLASQTHTTEEIIIPNEAIRFRIVGESNKKEDQIIKEKVKQTLEEEVVTLLEDSTSLEETRQLLKNNTPYFKQVVSNVLLQEKANPIFQIHYGFNYFPLKEYQGITYEEGYYESLVVTLGEGNGENWWCVLFPPLCLLEGNDTVDKVEYKSYVKEMIDKYF